MISRLATSVVLVSLFALVVPLATVAQETGAGFPLRPRVAQTGDIAPDVHIRGSGWGHGVGMSQYGAYAKARAGRTAEQILTHYYPGTAPSTDSRATGRIRVGVLPGVPGSLGVASTWVSNPANNQPIDWLACTPSGDDATGRVPMAHCTAFVAQPANTSWRLCPTGSGLKVVSARASENQLGCAGPTLHQTTAPVVRINHHGQVISTPWHGSGTRTYIYGWRDVINRGGGYLLVVQDIDQVDKYLRGLGEVPSSWGVQGPAALDAQAITGRTFAIRRLESPRGASCACDLLASPSDQAYIGYDKETESGFGHYWVGAVARTAGQVLRYNGALAQTFYSSSHGLGRSENVEDSWAYGTTAVPYLRSVDDPWSLEPPNPRAAWTRVARNNAVATLVSASHPQTFARVERIHVLRRTEGRTPRELLVTAVTANGQRETFTFTGRVKGIAGADLRRNLRDHERNTLPSSQIQALGFAPFTDDDGTTHEYAITWANRAGIADGMDATTFRPSRSVNRGQMASFIFRTFDIPEATERDRFQDVDPASDHAAAIDALAEAGVVSGFGDGTFRPTDPVTRAQMATFIANAAGLDTSDTSTPFSDVSPDDTHAGAIGAVAREGITTGCTADRYCPRDPVTRGQMSAFLHRTARR